MLLVYRNRPQVVPEVHDRGIGLIMVGSVRGNRLKAGVMPLQVDVGIALINANCHLFNSVVVWDRYHSNRYRCW